MNQIKCPNCGKEFTVDELSYNSIVKQIRDHEFAEELKKKDADYQEKLDSAIALALEKERLSQTTEKNELQATIQSLKADLDKNSKEAELDKNKALEEMREKLNQYENDNIRLKQQLDGIDEKMNMSIEKAISDERLKFQEELSRKDKELSDLNGQLNTMSVKADLDLNNAVNEQKNIQSSMKQEYEARIAADNIRYENELNLVKDELERVKEHKLALSTKGVGEDLEQYCLMEFNKVRMSAYRNASFEKDNTVTGGTKGDFIFRDYNDGVEYISIMFEMKNEAENSRNHQTNEQFFKKLDEDRRKKNCEYAVLVSMLEQDNDYYNQGIVEVYQYEKMYVVRPNMFLNIISLLRNAALDIVSTKQELENARATNIDVNTFKSTVSDIISKVQTHNKNATAQFEKTIKYLDETIDSLKDAKEALLLAGSHLSKEEKKLLELEDTKLLTKKAPKVAQMFAAADEDNVVEG
ncbi:MAG: DUF2130 domain-containing protein [Erysipelotrichaceae bacterium]|jgi:hypothetical protein|nr:DUF2130 domain-containing protein [Erysipelotrichaceae bacterium]